MGTQSTSQGSVGVPPKWRKLPAAGGEWLKTPIVSRPLASQGMRAVWPNVFDARFFIRVMEPNLATRPPR